MPFQQADWSGTLATMLTRGDVNVAVIDFPEIVALKKKGVPVEMVVPKEGVVAFEQSFNILKHAPSKEAAYQYLNFILGPQVQEMMAKEFYTSPSNVKSQVPAELQADIPVNGPATCRPSSSSTGPRSTRSCRRSPTAGTGR